ncbi:unnamed protein product, partial [Durusdinium trenchii]
CLLAFFFLLVGYLVVDLVGRTGFVELGKPGVGQEQSSPGGRLTSPIRKYNRDGGAGRWNYRGGGGRGIHVFRAAGPCDGWRRTICYCMAYRSAPWHFETMFLVVLKRAGGLIGAIPLGVISDEEIQRGLSEASPHAMLGASTTIMVPGVHQDPSGGWELSGIEVALLVLEWLAAQGLARPEGPYQVDEEVEVTAQSGETAPPKAKGRSPRAGRDGFLELYNRQRRPGEQGKVPAKEERSRERPLPEHGRRGGELEEPSLVDSFGGSSGKTLQLPDLEMNF